MKKCRIMHFIIYLVQRGYIYWKVFFLTSREYEPKNNRQQSYWKDSHTTRIVAASKSKERTSEKNIIRQNRLRDQPHRKATHLPTISPSARVYNTPTYIYTFRCKAQGRTWLAGTSPIGIRSVRLAEFSEDTTLSISLCSACISLLGQRPPVRASTLWKRERKRMYGRERGRERDRTREARLQSLGALVRRNLETANCREEKRGGGAYTTSAFAR